MYEQIRHGMNLRRIRLNSGGIFRARFGTRSLGHGLRVTDNVGLTLCLRYVASSNLDYFSADCGSSYHRSQ